MGAIFLAILQAASVSMVATAPTDEFVVEAPGRVLPVKVAGDSLTGPVVQAKWSGNSLRGSAFNRPLDLTINGDRIEGLIAGRQVNVHVTQTASGLRLQGLYGGQPTDITIGQTHIDGHIGMCGYSMNTSGEIYRGTRQCGRAVNGQASLQIPRQLASAPPMRMAADLAVLLGNG